MFILMTPPALSFATFNDASEGRSSQGQKSESSLDHVETNGVLLQYQGLNDERKEAKRGELSE